LTIANADGRLETPGKAISDVQVETGTTIVNDRFGGRQKFRAQGGFVVVTFRLENTGDEPTYARDPTLVVDGKRYSADPAKQSYLPRAQSLPDPAGRVRDRSLPVRHPGPHRPPRRARWSYRGERRRDRDVVGPRDCTRAHTPPQRAPAAARVDQMSCGSDWAGRSAGSPGLRRFLSRAEVASAVALIPLCLAVVGFFATVAELGRSLGRSL
jgi:hypothetical protein